jgi:anti-anti-sigma factor
MSTPFSPVTVLARLHLDVSFPSPSTVRVAVTGELDLATAPALRGRLVHVLHEQSGNILEVDLAGVTFLDCAGIGALVALRNVALVAGRQMRVTHPQRIVRRILDVTGVLGVLTAPIDRPQPRPTGSGAPSGTQFAPMTTPQTSSVMPAA